MENELQGAEHTDKKSEIFSTKRSMREHLLLQTDTEGGPLSPDKPIPGGGCTPNNEKRTLPRTLADISEVGCVTALGACRTKNARNIHQSPWTGSGILTRFPFVTGGCDLQLCTLMQ
ncbi:hypothetical protein MN116_009088 [Schistosoma mekongi]|uniref:Uncharacterized protein n=1 Tax=Schistosoma mekongi TaxID=38744 RepID=A0AAE2D116_SCHME|nr:hypothetical protein MN116_009088 [Schistosoma mekongi]